MTSDEEHHTGIDRRIINDNTGNMQIYGQGHNCQITIVGPLIPRNRHGISLNTSNFLHNRGTVSEDVNAGRYQGSNYTIINNNPGPMTVVGQGPNSQVHLGFSNSFLQDTGAQCATTHYTVTQTMNRPSASDGPSSSPRQSTASYHDNQGSMNAGVPSSTAAHMNGMISLIGSDLLETSSVQRKQYRVTDAELSCASLAPTFVSEPAPVAPMLHPRTSTLDPTPTPIPIPLTSSQAMVLSPSPATAQTPLPTRNVNLITAPDPSAGPPPTNTSDVSLGCPSKLLACPTNPLPAGITPSSPHIPRTVNQESPSSVTDIIPAFQPIIAPLLNMDTFSHTYSTSTEGVDSLLTKAQETSEKRDLSRLSVQPSPLSRANSSASESIAPICMDAPPRAQNVNQDDLPVMDTTRRVETRREGLHHATKKKKYRGFVSWVLRRGSLVRLPSLI